MKMVLVNMPMVGTSKMLMKVDKRWYNKDDIDGTHGPTQHNNLERIRLAAQRLPRAMTKL